MGSIEKGGDVVADQGGYSKLLSALALAALIALSSSLPSSLMGQKEGGGAKRKGNTSTVPMREGIPLAELASDADTVAGNEVLEKIRSMPDTPGSGPSHSRSLVEYFDRKNGLYRPGEADKSTVAEKE